MKTLRTSLIVCILSPWLFGSPTACKGIYYADEAPNITNVRLAPKTRELCYSAFALNHSGLSRTPLWSAERLSREGLKRKTKRSDDFHPDENLPADERAELADYARSGYDRGHMAPSADMSTKQAQSECFTLANMVPQNSENNRGIWSAIEGTVRHLAKEHGEVYVITGPLYTGSDLKRIGGRVLVPTALFKAVYFPSLGRGAAYVADNAPGGEYREISIAELEKTAGINLFPTLSDETKEMRFDLPEPILYGKKRYHKEDDTLEAILRELLRWLR